jgi:hypothetical protein
MRDTYNSNFVQVTVAILIVVNFAANAYEAQKNGHLTYPDGSPTPDAQVLELLDTVFTVVFAGRTLLALPFCQHWKELHMRLHHKQFFLKLFLQIC